MDKCDDTCSFWDMYELWITNLILVDNGWELNEIGKLNIYGTIFAIFGSLISYFFKKN